MLSYGESVEINNITRFVKYEYDEYFKLKMLSCGEPKSTTSYVLLCMIITSTSYFEYEKKRFNAIKISISAYNYIYEKL